MSNLAVVFPGQGAQRPGMGSDFFAASAIARAIYEEASDAIEVDLPALCFAPDERLRQTEYAQPAILATEMAMFRVLQAECGLQPTHFGGHSLGEYTALTAAGVLGLSQAVRLVRERGRRMQAAVPLGRGSMMALTGRNLDLAAIEICLEGLAVDVASVNSPHQLVLSGLAEAISAAAERISASTSGRGVKQYLLVVSAPFHSRLLAQIEPVFRRLLEAAAPDWRVNRAHLVTANFTGRFHVADRAALVDALTRQISGRVRWAENALALVTVAPTRLIEIGPTSVLRGLLLHAGIRARSVTSFTDRHILGKANVV